VAVFAVAGPVRNNAMRCPLSLYTSRFGFASNLVIVVE